MSGSWNYLSNGKRMLAPLLLSAVLFSCSKESLLEQSSSENELSLNGNTADVLAATSSVSPNVIFRETFDGSSVWSGVYKQLGTSYAFTVANSPVMEGSKSGRFELRDTDPMQSSGTRAEVLFPEQSKLNRWYAYSVYFPSATYQKDSYTEIISQWHQGGGKSPSIALEIKADRFNLVMPSESTQSSSLRQDLGAIKKDSWNRVVWHINHSTGSDGLIQLWINGTKILERKGPNMYSLSSSSSPRWKMGIYKWKWNDNMTTDVSKRVLYFDDVRMGNENATYSDMAAGVATTEPAPTEPAPTEPAPTAPETTEPVETTQPTTSGTAIQSFTLVNASTEKDVVTVTNGATISLSKYGVTKFNIRANGTSTVTSVNFALSGQQSRNYTDKQLPFSVQGDSGTGNYYYGSWESYKAYGSYTLKATPYAGTTAGTATTINFTIAK